MIAACPMCRGVDVPCRCAAGDVRRGMLLLTIGWGGDQRTFHRQGNGWRLGDGLIVTPWINGAPIPDDPWMALEQIEATYRDERRILLDDLRRRIAPQARP